MVAAGKERRADAPLYHALSSTGLPLFGGFAVLLADAFISPSGTGWIYIGASARVFYGMSLQGDLPSPLTQVSQR